MKHFKLLPNLFFFSSHLSLVIEIIILINYKMFDWSILVGSVNYKLLFLSTLVSLKRGLIISHLFVSYTKLIWPQPALRSSVDERLIYTYWIKVMKVATTNLTSYTDTCSSKKSILKNLFIHLFLAQESHFSFFVE